MAPITSGSDVPQIWITKVTFTQIEGKATIQLWFGSSGGGLPRRPELKSSGRFYFGAGLIGGPGQYRAVRSTARPCFTVARM